MAKIGSGLSGLAEYWSLRWRTNINFAKNRNKVLDLGGPDRLFAELLTTDFNFPGTVIQVGQPIGVFYGAGHMHGLQEILVGQMGFKRTGVEWRTAWDMRKPEEDKHKAPANEKR